MSGKMMRTAFRGAVLLASVSSGASAWAQTVNLGTPRTTVDENGVDLATGQYLQSPVSISIGGNHGLSWSPGRADITRSGMAVIYNNQTGKNEYYVGIAGQVVIFTYSDSTFSAKERNGATLTYSSSTQQYTFTDRAGNVLILKAMGNTAVPGGQVDYAPISLSPTDGDKLTFNYSSTSWTSYGSNPPYSMRTHTWNRLSSITNDIGYGLYISYQSDTAGDRNNSYPYSTYFQAKKIELSRTGGCATSSSQNCDLPTAWPRIDITYSSSGFTYTDAAGATTTITQPGAVWTAIRYPGSASDDVTIGYANDKVSSVAKSGVTTNYGYADSGDTRTVTVTRGSLPSRVRTFRISTLQLLTDQWKTDPSGPTYTRTYSYDQSTALLTRITEPEGNYTGYSYDARGNVTETRQASKTSGTPADLVSSATYDPTCNTVATCNQPNTTTDVRGKVTEYTYDAVHGGVRTVTGPAPDPTKPNVRPRTEYSYNQIDSTGAPSSSGVWMLIKVTRCATATTCSGAAAEEVTEFGYGSNLNLTTITRRAGDNSVVATTSIAYDKAGNALSVDGPLAGSDDVVRTRYDVLRRPVGTTGPDPDGSGARLASATRTTYNTDGTVQKIEQGTDSTPAAADFNGFTSLQQVSSAYDDYHRKVKDVLTAGGTTYAVAQQSYDSLGRVDCTVTRMDPGQWSNQTDACSPQTTGPNGPDRVVRRSYDAASRLTAVTSAYGTNNASTESTSYTGNDRTATVTDGKGNVTAFAYDGFDRPWRTCFQTTTSAACEGSPADYLQTNYDTATGDVSSARLRDGQSISYAYDGLGRLKKKDRPNNIYWETDQSYDYDLLGRLTSASDSNGRTLGFGYDALGRRTSQSDNWYGWGNASYQYDAAGQRTRMTWNDGSYVSYDYLTTGVMNTIRDSGGKALVTFDYDDLGQRTSLTRANGTSTGYSYDPASRLTELTLSGGNQPNSIRFGDSAAGQPGYNPARQIIRRSASNGAYAWTGAYNVDRGYGVNGLNQLTSAGSTNLGYDGRGNLTTSGSSSYGYTVDNQLATAPGANLAYDPMGRLFNITSDNGINTTLTYDGADVIAEVDQSNGNLLRRYVYGPGSDEPLIWYEGAGFGDRRWLHADERGSIVAVTNDAGNAIALNTYDDFGIPGANNIGRFQYTGQKWLPNLGLYDYKARMYSPTLGRFMQTDPIGYDAGLNWYNYVGGDPVNMTDPSGLDPAPEASCGINEVWNSVLNTCEVVANGRRDRPSYIPFPQTYGFPSSGVMPLPGAPQSGAPQKIAHYDGPSFCGAPTVGALNKFNPFGRINSGKAGNALTARNDLDMIAALNGLASTNFAADRKTLELASKSPIPIPVGNGWYGSYNPFSGYTTFANSGLGLRYNSFTGGVNLDIPSGFKLPNGETLQQNETCHYNH